MSVIFNKKEIKAIFYNGNEIVQGWYNHNKVWEKVVELFITGTVSNTQYVPRVYVNSSATSEILPSGGTWLDTTLEGNIWKIDLSDRLPLTGMAFMFYVAYSTSYRNRYIDKIVLPSNIDTSHVTSMYNMFGRSSVYYDSIITIEGLEHLDTLNVTNMQQMFDSCGKLQTLDLSNWNTSNVTTMFLMFRDCRSLTSVGDLSNWNTSNVTSMLNMFRYCSSLATIGLPQIGDGTKSVDTTDMFYDCTSLANITASGPIYNTVDFSSCPLTFASAKVVLNALQEPYSGAQTLTFSTSTVNLIQQDQEALGLVAENVALGWTINVALPETIFRVNAGSVQDGLTVAQFPSGTQVTEYESDKYYQITACTADTVDFSGRDVKTALYLDYPSINTIDVSDNSNLTKLVFNHENTNDMTIKFYNTGIDTDWTETINNLASKNIERSVTLYFGSQLNVGEYQYEADGPVEDAYVVFTFNADGTYTDDWYGCKKYRIEALTLEGTDWVKSTYTKPSDAPSDYAMYMSDSNVDIEESMAKAYFTASQGMETVDLYINSYAESEYDYTVAFSLDTDWTEEYIPRDYSEGVIENTSGFQYNPSESITGYKKVTYNIPQDGQVHKILVIYTKDESSSEGYDRGFVLVPSTKIEIPKPTPEKTEITGTVTDTTYVPSVYVNSSYTGTSFTPTGGTRVDTTLDTDTKVWKIDLSDKLPLTGAAFMFSDLDINQNNDNIDHIEFPENFDTSNVTSMYNMFSYISKLKDLDISSFDTSKVTNMSSMFYYCEALTSLNISSWDTSKVTNMSHMFQRCSTLTSLNISSWDTHNVVNMQQMFAYCPALTSVGEISNWNVGNVTDMSYMFDGCSSLTSIDLSNWNTSNVTDMGNMFDSCTSLETVNLSGANLSNVTNMHSMFAYCNNLREVNMEGCTLSNVTEMWLIFAECENLTTLYMPGVGDGLHNTGVFAITFDNPRVKSVLANIPSAGPIYNDVDFSNCPLTIESAKVVLNALQEPYSGAQSLRLSSSTMVLILADPEAQALAQEKAALGWTISA